MRTVCTDYVTMSRGLMRKFNEPVVKLDEDIHIKCSEWLKRSVRRLANKKGLTETALVRMVLTELVEKESKKED